MGNIDRVDNIDGMSKTDRMGNTDRMSSTDCRGSLDRLGNILGSVIDSKLKRSIITFGSRIIMLASFCGHCVATRSYY